MIGLLSTLVVLAGGLPAAWYVARRGEGEVTLKEVATSKFESVSPLRLGQLRCLISAYCFFVLIFAVIRQGHATSLVYSTYWNWTILAVYFGCSGAASLLFARAEGEWPRLATACQVLSSLVPTMALAVDVVFWLLLFPLTSGETRAAMFAFHSVNMHALNMLFVLVEILLQNTRPRARDLSAIFVLAVLYSVFTIARVAIQPATSHCLLQRCERIIDGVLGWPYFFMSTASGIAAVWYAIFYPLYWGFFKLQQLLRNFCFRRFESRPPSKDSELRSASKETAASAPPASDEAAPPVTVGALEAV